jgi:hemerythrin-like domain-containing protein
LRARRDYKEKHLSDTGSPYADTSHMPKVHTMSRRELALLPALVRSVPATDEERAEVVADHIMLLSQVLHHHHSGENAVLWPLLLARAPREIDPVVHLAEGHHRAIDELLTRIEVLLGTWTSGAAAEDGEALARALERLAVTAYEHMGVEERLVLPVAGRHVFASEWEAMVASEAATVPPEIGPVLAGMLMYVLPGRRAAGTAPPSPTWRPRRTRPIASACTGSPLRRAVPRSASARPTSASSRALTRCRPGVDRPLLKSDCNTD